MGRNTLSYIVNRDLNILSEYKDFFKYLENSVLTIRTLTWPLSNQIPYQFLNGLRVQQYFSTGLFFQKRFFKRSKEYKYLYWLEGDRNRNLKALTRNIPGIRYSCSVHASQKSILIGNWLGTWFYQLTMFLAKPRSSGLIYWCKPGNSWYRQEVPGFSQEVPGFKQ